MSNFRATIDRAEERLCTCGHNIWYHEDAEGGTHECNFAGCSCSQFKDADDAAVIESAKDG